MRDIITNDVIPAYIHDGSENFIDGLELKISDGKFEHREKIVSLGTSNTMIFKSLRWPNIFLEF